LSALSAEIATVHDRRSGLLIHNMGLKSHAWSIVDAFGNSEVGFWPLLFPKTVLLLQFTAYPILINLNLFQWFGH